MNTAPTPPTPVASNEWQLQRLQKVLTTVLILLALLLLQYTALQRWWTAGGLALGGVGLAVAWWLARAGRQAAATRWMVWSLTLLITYQVWVNQGLRDAALLGYPGVLVFAGMLGRLRLLLSVLAFQVAVVALLVLANTTGWHVHEVKPVQVSIFLDVTVILCLTGLGVWLIAQDLRRALRELRNENERVHDSRKRIEFLAHHDALTGLPNRVLARERLQHIVAQSRSQGELAVVLHVDLDNFKSVNDSMGHAAGDECLRLVAQRMTQWIGSGGSLCRPAGDEFLLLLGGFQSRDAVADYVAKLLSRMAEPLPLHGLAVPATLSMGVAIYPDDGEDFDELTKKADMAMYRAKEAGRNTFRFYDPEMNASVMEHLHLAAGMREALAQSQFELHYQPQVWLDSGRVFGAEALIRWRHPELGLVPPGRFIPVAEKSGLIVEVGAWVLQEACRQGAAWQQQGWTDFRMAVNLSPVQFRHGNLELVVANALDRSGLSPRHLELEITESLFIADVPMVAKLLNRLRAMGVHLSIDDFGTGYSNLGYLKRFEVGCLKIDQSFTRKLLTSDEDRAIVSAIVQMARGLRLQCVAEGIEDEATLALLRDMGCEMGQGFFWSPPLPAAAFTERFGPSMPG